MKLDFTYTAHPADIEYWSMHLPYHNRLLNNYGDCIVCCIRFGIPLFELYGNYNAEWKGNIEDYKGDKNVKINPDWTLNKNKEIFKDTPQGLLVKEWHEDNN